MFAKSAATSRTTHWLVTILPVIFDKDAKPFALQNLFAQRPSRDRRWTAASMAFFRSRAYKVRSLLTKHDFCLHGYDEDW